MFSDEWFKRRIHERQSVVVVYPMKNGEFSVALLDYECFPKVSLMAVEGIAEGSCPVAAAKTALNRADGTEGEKQ